MEPLDIATYQIYKAVGLMVSKNISKVYPMISLWKLMTPGAGHVWVAEA